MEFEKDASKGTFCGALRRLTIGQLFGDKSKYDCRIQCLKMPNCNAIEFSNLVTDGKLAANTTKETPICILLQCPEDYAPSYTQRTLWNSHFLLPECD